MNADAWAKYARISAKVAQSIAWAAATSSSAAIACPSHASRAVWPMAKRM